MDLLLLYKVGFVLIGFTVLGGFINHDEVKCLFLLLIDFIIVVITTIALCNN